MYQRTLSDTAVLRLSDSAFIPKEAENQAWKAYLEWLSDGNEPLPATPIQPQPRSATAKQIRYALSRMGMLKAWLEAVAASSEESRIYWECEPDPPENNAKLKRFALNAGIDLAAVFDLATTL